MKLIIPCIRLFIMHGILLSMPLYGLLKGITQTVEKTTAGAAKTIERATGALVPPAEKVVEVPLEIAKKTTTGVADIFRGPSLRITNKAKHYLTVEMMGSNKKIYKIISIYPDDQETFDKPYAVSLFYGDIKTEVVLEKKGPKDKPILMNVSLENDNIHVQYGRNRPEKKVHRESSPRRTRRKTETK